MKPAVSGDVFGPVDAPEVLAGYRSLAGTNGFIVIGVAVHVDFADDRSDADLIRVLSDLLTASQLTTDDPREPEVVLNSLHDSARKADVYASAAVAAVAADRVTVARAGRAALNLGRGLDAETMLAEQTDSQSGLLTNPLGSLRYDPPGELSVEPHPNRYRLTVGTPHTEVDETDLPTAPPLPDRRGGLLIVL